MLPKLPLALMLARTVSLENSTLYPGPASISLNPKSRTPNPKPETVFCGSPTMQKQLILQLKINRQLRRRKLDDHLSLDDGVSET